MLFRSGVAVLSVIDELLQSLTAGRGAQFIDVLLDVAGGSLGVVFALCAVWLVGKIVQKYRKKEQV